MPFTPLHFGPGLLLKGLSPRSISIISFAGANVIIDAEVLVNLLLGRYPLHGLLHTFPAAFVVGLLTGLALHYTFGQLKFLSGSAEFTLWPAMIGGILGGLSQPIMDGFVYGDVAPFWPVTTASPFFGSVGIEWLRLLALSSGLLGGMLILFIVLWSQISNKLYT